MELLLDRNTYPMRVGRYAASLFFRKNRQARCVIVASVLLAAVLFCLKEETASFDDRLPKLLSSAAGGFSSQAKRFFNCHQASWSVCKTSGDTYQFARAIASLLPTTAWQVGQNGGMRASASPPSAPRCRRHL